MAGLRAALIELTQRHEILRTTFDLQPGARVPVQTVRERLDPGWEVDDLTGVARSDASARLTDLVEREQAAPLDLEAGPLVRGVFGSLGEGRHALVLSISALCIDTGSLGVALQDLVALYGGTGAVLLDDPLQYPDFTAWQRELASSEDEEMIASDAFWEAARSLQAPSVPFVWDGGSTVGPGGGVELGPLDDDVLAGLKAQAERYGVALDVLIQAAWYALLGRLSGEPEVAIAYVSSASRHADVRGAVGVFSAPVPIGARVGRSTPIPDVLTDVKRGREEAIVCQDYAPPDGSGALAVGFIGVDGFQASGGGIEFALETVVVPLPTQGLSLVCVGGESPQLSLQFDPVGADRGTVQRLADQLKLVLGALALDAGVSVGELGLVDDAERERTIRRFNDTSAVILGPPVHGLIAAHAARSPETVAVRDETSSMSYAELDARANQLAHRLRRAGVGPDVAVGLCTDRSVDMVVGVLGIMKAGGAYVPLHSEHPPARLAQQLTDAEANVLVTQSALLTRVADGVGEVVCLDRDRAELDGEPTSAPDGGASHENLAYIVFTSGSTGTPKGVAVTHGNLVNYVTDIARQLGADGESLSFGMVSSISTDLGNTALFGALCSGGTLVLVDPDVAADPNGLAIQFARQPVDILKITPSHLGALLAGGDGSVLPRRTLVIGGERASWDLVARIRALSECQILNHYGPTETTVGCTTFRVPGAPGRYAPGSVPIGHPMANTTCYVLDERRRPLPIGVAGRLFVGGAGVARGYVGRPDLTAERFLADPFSPAIARMYDTGDLARWLPDGALEFLGRADEQVKVRGYRVEPAEVEVALRSHPCVTEAVVLARATATGDHELVAYCAAAGSVVQVDLRAHLIGLLPEFMLPVAVVVLDSLPMTPSGKVDRLALPDPERSVGAASTFVAPQTPLQEALALLWIDVLGVSRVGITDDFFALGGHSLLAPRLVARICNEFAVDLPLHSLFLHLTVESLAAEIAHLIGDDDGREVPALVAEGGARLNGPAEGRR